MSIFISEINMPEGEGCKLVLQIFPSGEVYDEHGFRLGLTKWCKAIPVPPHGRLIDADALEYHADNVRDPMGRTEKTVMWKKIEAAPTIIPAEEEPNGRA